MRVELGELVVQGKWHRPGERVKEKTAECVHIGPRIHRLAAPLFGRPRVDGPQEGPGPGQALTALDVSRVLDVGETDVAAAARPRDQAVRGLHVVMYEA